MRSILLPATLIAALGLGTAVMAAETATGTVKSYDFKARTLTLDDGTVYHLAGHLKKHAYKAGEKVTVAWEMKGKKHEATKVTIDK